MFDFDKFRAELARGTSSGKAARKAALPLKLADWQVQSLSELATMTAHISSEVDVFKQAYRQVESCMYGEGEGCHAFYTPMGVEIAVLADSTGRIVARALVRDGKWYTSYGEYHYVLDTLLEVDGYENTPNWLEGAELVEVGTLKEETRFDVLKWFYVRSVYETKELVLTFKDEDELVSLDAKASEWLESHKGFRLESCRKLRNFWTAEITATLRFSKLARAGRHLRITEARPERFVRFEGERSFTPYVDGYAPCVTRKVQNDEETPWHPYEWAEAYA